MSFAASDSFPDIFNIHGLYDALLLTCFCAYFLKLLQDIDQVRKFGHCRVLEAKKQQVSRHLCDVSANIFDQTSDSFPEALKSKAHLQVLKEQHPRLVSQYIMLDSALARLKYLDVPLHLFTLVMDSNFVFKYCVVVALGLIPGFYRLLGFSNPVPAGLQG